jgi:hypothetical protein
MTYIYQHVRKNNSSSEQCNLVVTIDLCLVEINITSNAKQQRMHVEYMCIPLEIIIYFLFSYASIYNKFQI